MSTSMGGGWPGPRDAVGRVNISPATSLAEIFTVIHRGGEIDPDVALDVLEAATAWAVAADLAPRVVDVWAAPWNRLVLSCVATVAAFGGLVGTMHLPVADDVVAKMKARGIAVRHRRARQSAVDDAELRAVSHGWPVRYL